MAILKVSTSNRILVNFQEQELRPYSGLEARVVIWQKQKFVNFSMPFMTWQGHDLRAAQDLIDALKMVGNFIAKITKKRAGWSAHSHPPTILRKDKIRVPVYRKFSEPYVQIERDDDGFFKWTVQGHYFNDDLPSVVAYVAALTKLVALVKENGY